MADVEAALMALEGVALRAHVLKHKCSLAYYMSDWCCEFTGRWIATSAVHTIHIYICIYI